MAVNLSFNDVFKYIGDTGFYQLLLYFVVCLPSFFDGLQNMSANFFSAPMDHWCKISRLENFSFETQKKVAIPYVEDESTEHQSCQMYDLYYDNLTDDQILNWDRNITRNTSLIDCTEWIFDQSEFISTINSKYNLVCDRSWMAELTSTVYMGGVLVGSVISGLISDRFGRKLPMLMFMIGYFLFALLQAFAPNYTLFVVFRFFASVSSMSTYLCTFVIVMEILGPSHYVLLAVTFQIFFSVGFMLIPGIAYSIRDHEILQIAITLPLASLVPCIWLVPESPRWLISQGKYKKAEKILHNISDVNRVDFPEEVTWINKSEDGHEEKQERGKWADICNSRTLCTELALIYINWFTVSLVYYGVSYNAGAFGDVFLNTFLSGLIEIPSNLFAYLVLERCGRRWPNGGILLATAVIELSLVPILLVRPDMSELLTALSTLGKGAITFAFSSIYLYTSELFPTPIRHLAVGSSSVFARIGSMAAPYLGDSLEEIWLPMPSVIFAVISAITGSLVLLLPETKGHKIPDTIEEAEKIGRSRRKRKLIIDSEILCEVAAVKREREDDCLNKEFGENMINERVSSTSEIRLEDVDEDGLITRL
ncbi:hypothetical protein LSH36_1273g00029 [Paralvinella palmiformis]|uniref:Major facilitator superfamily (MFS) profile domain-containing protein n=1 Tax=Paralvinella palmiformis TaxID=53620 RepID=A0AAD9MPL1_9ANNE|nr:hypothetical protein LSH36_1273g00029 [Paralvinella palmiformis]